MPLSWLYGLGIWARNLLFDNGILPSRSFNVPILSVGNLTVGGTGKTPHSEYLLHLLGENHKTAYLSRGYKRATRDFRIVSQDASSREAGDEALQIKNRFPGTTVAVDRKRVNGVEELLKLSPPIEAIVLDDAYQHRYIRPGFSILLVDFHRNILDDRLLPAGRLREPARNRHRANIILVTRTPADIKPIEMREIASRMSLSNAQHLFFTTIRYESLEPVFPEAEKRSLDWFSKHNSGVLLVCGVASPDHLIRFARQITTNLEVLTFKDHHGYAPADVEQIMSRLIRMAGPGEPVTIITTEKDAVKLKEMKLPDQIRERMYALRIGVEFLNNDKEEFNKHVLNYVKSNKRGSILHQGKN